MNHEGSKKEIALDIVKEFLIWIVVTGLAFVWWIAVLMIASLILLNVWMVTFQEILKITAVLTVITSVLYLIRIFYKKFHE
ncbi:MAG: hypothetical protein ACI4ES_03935 [Roseburia sp.]